MATPTRITIDDVRHAISGLQAQHRTPSVRLIRRALGNRGSNETIMRLKDEILGVPASTDDAKPPTNLLLRIQDVAPELWRAAVTDAKAAVAQDLRQLEEALRGSQAQAAESAQQLDEAQRQLATERSEREALAAAVQAQAGATQTFAERQSATSQHLVQQGDAIADLRATVGGQGEAFRTLLQEAQGRWAAEATAWAARTAADLDRIAELRETVARLQAERDAQHQAAVAAEARAAAAQARADAAERARATAEGAAAAATTESERRGATITAQTAHIAELRAAGSEAAERIRQQAFQQTQQAEALAAAQRALADALAAGAAADHERSVLLERLAADHAALRVDLATIATQIPPARPA